MKVLHVIDALGVGGGAEHSLATLLPRLRDRGVTSSVATLVPREGGLQAELSAQGFGVSVLSGRRVAGQALALRRRIRAERPDLVHATLVNSCLMARTASLGLGVPQLNSLVNTTYDPVRIELMGIAPWKLQLVRGLDGFTARHRVDHFHAITGAVRDEGIERLGLDPRRITVIPRGRQAELLGTPSAARRSRARQALGIGDDVPVVLNIGRQDGQKDQVGLVEAFARLPDGHPGALLLIAGREGSATPALREAIDRSGLGARVRLLGHRSDVPELLAAADVFAFPSLYEGLGCALIEAMAVGTPIVGSDAPAIAEVLDAGDLGVVVPRGDRNALTVALDRLLSRPDLRADLARRGRERFLERYELERVADATVDLYRSVLAP